MTLTLKTLIWRVHHLFYAFKKANALHWHITDIQPSSEMTCLSNWLTCLRTGPWSGLHILIFLCCISCLFVCLWSNISFRSSVLLILWYCFLVAQLLCGCFIMFACIFDLKCMFMDLPFIRQYWWLYCYSWQRLISVCEQCFIFYVCSLILCWLITF